MHSKSCSQRHQLQRPDSQASQRDGLRRGSISQRLHLCLADDQTKQALFSCSEGFQKQKLFLDDDHTKLQMEGRHSLAARKASLTGQGHTTCTPWWRRDVLCWADASGMHRHCKILWQLVLETSIFACLEPVLLWLISGCASPHRMSDTKTASHHRMEVTLFIPDIIPSDQPYWLPWMSIFLLLLIPYISMYTYTSMC